MLTHWRLERDRVGESSFILGTGSGGGRVVGVEEDRVLASGGGLEHPRAVGVLGNVHGSTACEIPTERFGMQNHTRAQGVVAALDTAVLSNKSLKVGLSFPARLLDLTAKAVKPVETIGAFGVAQRAGDETLEVRRTVRRGENLVELHWHFWHDEGKAVTGSERAVATHSRVEGGNEGGDRVVR